MLTRPLFFKYQKQILAFANTQCGKAYLGIKTDDKIVRLTPDGFHTFKDFHRGKIYLQGNFFSRSPYLAKFRLALTSLAILEEVGYKLWNFPQPADILIANYLGLIPQRANLPLLLLTDFVPDADPETNTVDGTVGYSDDAGITWASIHNAAAGTNVGPSATRGYALRTLAHGTSGWIRMSRVITLFLTSSIGSAATIDSATFSFYPDSTGDPTTNNYGGSIDLVASTPASNTNLVTDDYDQLGTTQFGTKTLASITDDTTNSFSLNASGLAAISKTGVTKFGVRHSYDRSNTEPTWVANNVDDCYIRLADYGSNKPTLGVTWHTDFTQNLSDTITLSDFKVFAFTKVASDTITLSDVASNLVTWIRSLSDTITLSDSIANAITKTFGDTITLSDNIVNAVGKVLADTITLSDSISQAFTKVLSDTITLTDSIIKGVVKSLSDTISLSDAISFLWNKAQRIAEIITSLSLKAPTGSDARDVKPRGSMSTDSTKPTIR